MAGTWKVPGYVVEQLLGRGASSEVWAGRIGRSGDRVALKRVFVTDRSAWQRVRTEAALLTALDHPNLVRLHDVVATRDALVLVLDLAAGGSLADLLEVRGRLSVGELITAVAPVAAALAHAHAAAVLHGDVTAANILFTDQGLPLLADLGVARLVGDERPVYSTPAYVDPAVALGAPPSPPSDVFMLGGVALHVLTGAPTWPGEPAASDEAGGATAEQALAAARAGRLDVQARLAAAGVPEATAAIVRRALDPDPVRRGSAAEFALDLRASGRPAAIALGAGRPRQPLVSPPGRQVHGAAAVADSSSPAPPPTSRPSVSAGGARSAGPRHAAGQGTPRVSTDDLVARHGARGPLLGGRSGRLGRREPDGPAGGGGRVGSGAASAADEQAGSLTGAAVGDERHDDPAPTLADRLAGLVPGAGRSAGAPPAGTRAAPGPRPSARRGVGTPSGARPGDPARGGPADSSRARPADPSGALSAEALADLAPTRLVGPRPRPVLPRPPDRRRRWGTLACAATGLAAVVVAVCLLVPGGAGAGARRAAAGSGRPTPSSAASAGRATPSGRAHPSAPVTTTAAPEGPAGATAWTEALRRLDDRRAAAFATGDPALLDAVYSAPDLLERDVALLRQLVPAGCRLTGVRTSFDAVAVAPRGETSAVVLATARIAPSARTCGGSRTTVPGVARTRLRFELIRTPAGVRIAGERPLS